VTQLRHRIEPLRPWLFDPAVAGELASLVCPPYDVISAETQRALYERNRFNIIRLEYARDTDRYAAAAATLREWLTRGVLVRAPAPALFLYTQTFALDGHRRRRDGLVARLRLEPFSQGRILPHERTFPGPKQDRLQLMRATRLNTSSIFGLYTGEHRAIEALQGQIGSREPLFDFVDQLGIRNELRVIDSMAEISAIQRDLQDALVLIADGHHRYETALNYQRERREPDRSDELRAFDYTLMSLVSCNDPGLVILPTHRIARGLDRDALARFDERVREYFDVERVDDVVKLRARLAENGRGSIGVLLRGARASVLKLRHRSTLSALMPAAADAVRKLDVSILHALIFARVLALTPEQIQTASELEYTTDADAALEAVRSGRADGAFLMNPPGVADVERVSAAGATMPEKSTYFFPKLMTGLVLSPLDDDSNQVP